MGSWAFEKALKACYRVEIEQEEDGRFLAEVVNLPGVMAYGETADAALAHVQALALRVLADRLDHDEGPPRERHLRDLGRGVSPRRAHTARRDPGGTAEARRAPHSARGSAAKPRASGTKSVRTMKNAWIEEWLRKNASHAITIDAARKTTT